MMNTYEDVINAVFYAIEEDRGTQAIQLLYNDAQLQRSDMAKVIDQLINYHEQQMTMELEQVDQNYTESLEFLSAIFVAFLTIAIAIVIMVIVMRSIFRSINNVTTVMDSVGTVSMSALPRVGVKSNDEIGLIGEAFNRMAETLEKLAQFQ
jgi:two-component system chemotaxis sensor kinase CheA